uniref:CN hydrolase domain-containing protein n=1 Tax=Globodera pallida TaxID=36090 RepID=A0A183C0N1_GLOPA
MVYVYLYPVNCIAIAVLHPGAVIRGQPFNDSGVLIRLDPFMGDMKFMRAFKDVQNRIGVDLRDHVPVAIQTPFLTSDVFLLLGWFGLFALFFKHGRAAGRQSLFIVKRKDGTGRAQSK